MAENGFTNLGDNFDKEKNEGVETTVAPAPQGRWELECVYSVEQTTEGGIRTDENGITCRNGMEGSRIDVDGLCMNCGEQGHNKLMMTRIPNFREIIIVAVECRSVSPLRRRPALRI